MTRYIPILLGALLIIGLTIPQYIITDRLSGTNVSAEQRAELLALVPKDFGDWHGKDKPVDPVVRKTAGAIGAISREYRNARTNEQVDLWLIVGHAREISFHTPDVCYPSSGFEARGKENAVYPLIIQGRPNTPMWTNTFYRDDSLSGRRTLLRVFWTWFNPEDPEHSEKVVWEAPTNPRWHFGNTRALYKMYFTSDARDALETADQSACIRFAKEFLPEVDKALLTMYGKGQPQGGDKAASPASEVPNEGDKAAPAPASTAPDAASQPEAPAAKDNSPAPTAEKK